MNPQILTRQQLVGVSEKLERAYENILNLGTEISLFEKLRPNEPVSDDERNGVEKLLKFLAEKKVPIRFSVIAGEIVHHLRSCLDHIVWLLSSDASKSVKSANRIGFPITLKEPRTKDEIEFFQAKIAGVSSVDGIRLIKELQPYNTPEPADHPLAIIHEFDRIDKHQNLVLVVGTFTIDFRVPVMPSVVVGMGERKPETRHVVLTEKMDLKLAHKVAFGKFGKRENQPVIPAMEQLFNSVRDVVAVFAGEA